MDNYASGGIGALVMSVIAGATWLYRNVNHKRSRCNLCGKKMEISVDVEETTPSSKDDARSSTNNKIPEFQEKIPR